METNSDVYDRISHVVSSAGLVTTAYGMYDNVNVPVVVAGLGVAVVSGLINYFRKGFSSRRTRREDSSELETRCGLFVKGEF
jgi:hypothetical protein